MWLNILGNALQFWTWLRYVVEILGRSADLNDDTNLDECLRRISRIATFTSHHLVQIKDVYEDGNDFVIVSETMDVTLRQLTGILQGPLKALQIAAICSLTFELLTLGHQPHCQY